MASINFGIIVNIINATFENNENLSLQKIITLKITCGIENEFGKVINKIRRWIRNS